MFPYTTVILCVRLVFSSGSLYCIVADPFFSLGVAIVLPLILIAILSFVVMVLPVFLSVIVTCMVMLSLVCGVLGVMVVLAVAWSCGMLILLSVVCLVL